MPDPSTVVMDIADDDGTGTQRVYSKGLFGFASASGHVVPFDTSLSQTAGGWAPSAVAYGATLPTRFADGIRWTLPDGSGVLHALPLGVSESAPSASQVASDKLLYPRAWPHVDVLTTALAEGVSEHMIVRSAEAGESLAWKVQVPVGSSLRIDDNGDVVLDRTGATTIVSRAPRAQDADALPVGAWYSIIGGDTDAVLVLHWGDTAASPNSPFPVPLTYPLNIDPDLLWPTEAQPVVTTVNQNATPDDLGVSGTCSESFVDFRLRGSEQSGMLRTFNFAFDLTGTQPAGARCTFVAPPQGSEWERLTADVDWHLGPGIDLGSPFVADDGRMIYRSDDFAPMGDTGSAHVSFDPGGPGAGIGFAMQVSRPVLLADGDERYFTARNIVRTYRDTTPPAIIGTAPNSTWRFLSPGSHAFSLTGVDEGSGCVGGSISFDIDGEATEVESFGGCSYQVDRILGAGQHVAVTYVLRDAAGVESATQRVFDVAPRLLPPRRAVDKTARVVARLAEDIPDGSGRLFVTDPNGMRTPLGEPFSGAGNHGRTWNAARLEDGSYSLELEFTPTDGSPPIHESAPMRVQHVLTEPLPTMVSASANVIQSNQDARIVASADPVFEGDTDHWLVITTSDRSRVVKTCFATATCVADVTRDEPGTDQYVAIVTDMSDLQSADASDPVSVTMADFEVSLTSSKGALETDQEAVVTAYLNQTVTHSRYWTSIWDTTTGTNVKLCEAGSSCSLVVNTRDMRDHAYRAYVTRRANGFSSVPGTMPPASSVSSGASVEVKPVPIVLMLAISNLKPKVEEEFTIQLTASQPIYDVPGLIFIDSVESDDRFPSFSANACIRSSDRSCVGVWRHDDVDHPATYRARIALLHGTYVLESQPISVSNPPYRFSVADIVVDAQASPDPYVFGYIEGSLNQPLDPDHVLVGYATDGTQSVVCSIPQTSCSVGYLATSLVGWGRPTVVLEKREFDGSSTPAYPSRTSDETTGGGNLSEEDPSRRCEGDPCDVQSGHFYENVTDLSIAGRGHPLEFRRTYDVSYAHELVLTPEAGRLGVGWHHNFDMRIEPVLVAIGNYVVDTGALTVVQENGSRVTFKEDEHGNFTAPPRVLGTLKRLADGDFVFTRHNRDRFVFHDHRLSKIVDLNGYTTTLQYDGQRLASVEGSGGRRLIFGYTDDRLTSVRDESGGREVTFDYENGVLRSATDPDLKTARYVYDARRRMTDVIDRQGRVTHNEFDELDRVTSQTDPNHRLLQFEYGADGLVTTVQGALRTEYRYVGPNLASETVGAGTADATTTFYSYFPETGWLKSKSDELGRTWEYEYDADGDRTLVRDPLHHETRSHFGSHNELLDTRNAENETTSYVYDDAANLLSVTGHERADGPPVTTTYHRDDAQHPDDVTSVEDASGVTKTLTYGMDGNVLTAGDEKGRTTSFGYDARGWRTSWTTPGGNEPGALPEHFTTSYVYDPLGRLKLTTDPLGRVSGSTYDAEGRILTSTSPSNSTVTNHYDDAGQLDVTTRPGGWRVARTYTATGRPATVQVGTRPVTTYEYDGADRLAKVTDPRNRETSYAYDAAGRRESKTDALQRTTRYHYDDADRLHDIDYEDAATPDVTFGYDDAGRRTSMEDGTGTAAYGYDDLGRMTHVESGAGAEVGLAYDDAGRPTEIDYPGASHSIGYHYDDAGDMDRLTDWATGVTRFGYDSDGAVDSISRPNGVDTSMTFDRSGAVSAIEHASSTGTIASFGVEYQPTGGLVSSVTSTGVPGAGSQAYGYSPRDEIESVTGGVGAGSFTFDDAGDLTMRPGGTMGYDDARQPTSFAPAAGPATAYTFNPMGERTAAVTGSDTTSYSYDEAGRLTSYASPTGDAATYAYDGDGYRASKTVGGVTQQMTWLPGGSLAKLLDDGDVSYVYGPSGMPVEQIDRSDHVSYFHLDQLGSVRATTDEAGSVTSTASYSPYGTATSTGDAPALGFAGEYTDAESGLVYLRARYYDPATAQFLTRDPIEDFTGDPYGYANGNPIMNTDPSGLWAAGITLGLHADIGFVHVGVSTTIGIDGNGHVGVSGTFAPGASSQPLGGGGTVGVTVSDACNFNDMARSPTAYEVTAGEGPWSGSVSGSDWTQDGRQNHSTTVGWAPGAGVSPVSVTQEQLHTGTGSFQLPFFG